MALIITELEAKGNFLGMCRNKTWEVWMYVWGRGTCQRLHRIGQGIGNVPMCKITSIQWGAQAQNNHETVGLPKYKGKKQVKVLIQDQWDKNVEMKIIIFVPQWRYFRSFTSSMVFSCWLKLLSAMGQSYLLICWQLLDVGSHMLSMFFSSSLTFGAGLLG